MFVLVRYLYNISYTASLGYIKYSSRLSDRLRYSTNVLYIKRLRQRVSWRDIVIDVFLIVKSQVRNQCGQNWLLKIIEINSCRLGRK